MRASAPADGALGLQKKKAEAEVGTGVSDKAGESSVFLNDAGDQVRHWPLSKQAVILANSPLCSI